MKQVRRGREFWAQLSAEVDSGDAVAAVARRWKVRERTLVWWRWQLRRSTPKTQFLPVVVKKAPERASSVEVHVDGLKLVVGVGTDARYVGELVAALRAC